MAMSVCEHGKGMDDGCPKCGATLKAATVDAAKITSNPFYVINIHPELAEEHQPIVDRAMWVAANENLMAEIGTRAWLEMLLDVLSGGYVRHGGVTR